MTKPGPPASSASARLARNRDIFERLVDATQRVGARGRHETSAAWAEVAAHFAWKSPPGSFVDDRLEQVLTKIGDSTLGLHVSRPPRRSNVSDSPGTVLHVMTDAFPIGGHTRLVSGWIEADRSRRHSVVFTHQTDPTTLPQRLLSLCRASGGWARALNWRRYRPIARAEVLRMVASEFDVVVLHVHPFDVVPAIGLARGGPPVVVVNHAGFGFWLGRDVADTVACLRPSNSAVAVQRRGLDSKRCLLLPIPISPPAELPLRSDSRKELGLPEDAVVLMTMGEPYKFVPFGPGPGFVDLVTEIALRDDRVHVIAIGPGDDGAWRSASDRTHGRVRAYGVRAETDLFKRATDLYLDPFPMTSATSLLETGACGVPVVSFCPHREGAPIMCADDASIDGLIVRAQTPEAFISTVRELIDDDATRDSVGRETAEAVLAGHGPDAFGAALEDAYCGTISMHGSERTYSGTGSPGPLDHYLAEMYAAARESLTVSQLLREHRDSFPPSARPSLWLRQALDPAIRYRTSDV